MPRASGGYGAPAAASEKAAALPAKLSQDATGAVRTGTGAASDPRGAAGVVARPELHREDRSRAYADGQHAKPTKASLQDRSGSPNAYNTSGIEQAMAKLADREHKRVFRGRK